MKTFKNDNISFTSNNGQTDKSKSRFQWRPRSRLQRKTRNHPPLERIMHGGRCDKNLSNGTCKLEEIDVLPQRQNVYN